MIKYFSKFLIIFLFILVFLGFKNQTKILNHNVSELKNLYDSELNLYTKRNVQLTKMIAQFQVDSSNYDYTEIKDIINFDRDSFNNFTVVQVNYDQSE